MLSFVMCADDHGVARHRHRDTELVTRIGVGSFQIGLLTPGRPVAHENVGRSGLLRVVVVLIAVDPSGVAVLNGAPTTMVSPEIATEIPKRSLASVLEAFR